jgi:hypothetical protein
MTKEELAARLDGVDGWLAAGEAWALHSAARDAPTAAPVAVEIGSWKGRSTLALALAFRERGRGTVVAVDPHRGAFTHRRFGEADTFAEFLANLTAGGVEGHVRAIRALSTTARAEVRDPIDLLFVDGSHAYEDVIADLEAWRDLLRPGATVAFHDASVEPGVRRAVRERVLRPGPFRRPRLVDVTLFVEHDPRGWRVGDWRAAAAVRARLRLGPLAGRFWARTLGRCASR